VKFRDGKSSTIKCLAKSVHVYTDGHRMVKRALCSDDVRGTASGVKVSANVERPLTFADIRMTGVDYAPSLNRSVLFTLSS